MDRKHFLNKFLLGIGSAVTLPTLSFSCSTNKDTESRSDPNSCLPSPNETAGPFPIKKPADLVRENIIGDRSGVPLLINIKVENINNNCEPLEGVLVDIWHCDAQGNYSEYSGQLDGNFTNDHFLRGRQTTDTDGIASFISIYPGWYPGRAPHLHLEIKRATGESLLITQTAFPESISHKVYSTGAYNDNFDTSNEEDFVFGSSLDRNMATSVTGNSTDGFHLIATIKVDA